MTAVAFGYDALGRRLSKRAVLHEWGEASASPEPRPLPGEDATERALIAVRAELRRTQSESEARAQWASRLDQASRGFPALAAGLRLEEGFTEPAAGPAADDVAGSVITWLFAPGSHAPLARLTADGGHGIVTDQVGAPLVVLGADGEARAQLVTDSRGRARVEGDEALCPWRFAGQYRDRETGLHYNRFRYYDADAGQYISRDPLGLRAGLRVYGYVADPGVQSDPLGLSPQPGGGCGTQRGSNNPKTRAAAVTGQEAHRQIQDELAEHGFDPEVTIRLSDGTVVRKDAVLPGTPVVIVIKPDTPSGWRAGEKRAEMMSDEGFEPVVILYDPKDPRYQPGSPTCIGPG